VHAFSICARPFNIMPRTIHFCFQKHFETDAVIEYNCPKDLLQLVFSPVLYS